jgi:hypothetical protein
MRRGRNRPSGVDAIVIDDDAHRFAEATVRLLTDAEVWQARRGQSLRI